MHSAPTSTGELTLLWPVPVDSTFHNIPLTTANRFQPVNANGRQPWGEEGRGGREECGGGEEVLAEGERERENERERE